MKFKYNGRIYNPSNVRNKLKKLGITMDDIEIIPEEVKEIEYDDTKKYYFKSSIGETIVSIYPNLDHLKGIINVSEYEEC